MKYTIKPDPEKFGNNFINVLCNFTFAVRYHFEYQNNLDFKIFLASYHVDIERRVYTGQYGNVPNISSYTTTYFKLQNIRDQYNHYKIPASLFREKGTDRTAQELKLAELFIDPPRDVVHYLFKDVNKREKALKADPSAFEPLHAEIEFIFSKRQFRQKIVEWFKTDRMS